MARSEDGTLKTFTSACGQLVFRGDRLGDGINGDYLVCEPVGRLIRRSAVRYADSGHIELTNRYEKRSGEFISSTDGNFRPVNLSTGPDGCLYIVDMYHGIIQERVYITDYLRGEILKAGYEKNVGRGRIYRVIREGLSPGPPPELLSATPARLVESLAHPNGWWRDTAQSLLVTRREVSATSALRKMVTDHEDALGRLHALWTLDGLEQLDKDTNRPLYLSPEAAVEYGVIDKVRVCVCVCLPNDAHCLSFVLSFVAFGSDKNMKAPKTRRLMTTRPPCMSSVCFVRPVWHNMQVLTYDQKKKMPEPAT